MNNEIKEILSYLKKKENTRRIKCITIEESKQLLDYITNLQQENEELKKKLDRRYYKNEYERIKKENERLQENNSNMQEEMARVWEENERLNLELSGYREAILRDDKLLGLQDYKSRCEKASEIINFEWEEIVEDECYENHLWSVDGLVIKKILNILQNGSEEK